MRKIQHLVFDTPGMYLFCGPICGALIAFRFSFNQAATILFWWYIVCAATVGLYMIWCNLITLMMSLADKDTQPGWNWDNRPSIQELKQEDPAQARVLAEIWDQLDQAMWKDALIRLLLIITIFVSLPLGAFFLREPITEVIIWWKFVLAFILLTYGFVTHYLCHR